MNSRPLGGPAAWHGDDLARDRGWTHDLTVAQIAELDAALNHALERDPRRGTIGRDDFPLPTLGPRLRAAAHELEHGRGVTLLRGIPVSRYRDEELRALFSGIGAWLGTPLFQNAHGELMRAITDEGAGTGERYGQIRAAAGGSAFLSSRARVASTGELRFHTDRADVVALLCVRPARAGGLTRIASSVAVHDALLASRPRLLGTLFRPWPRSRLGEETTAGDAWYALPVMGLRDGCFTSHYSRTFIEAAQLVDGVPGLDDAQWAAMDALAETAEARCLEMRFEPGDLQLLNSHVTYHARSAYEDDPRGPRLLYRLWLCPPGNRALPADHAVLWGNVEADSIRGGIGQAPMTADGVSPLAEAGRQAM